MTPTRAREIAEENGCTMERANGLGYWITRATRDGPYSRLVYEDRFEHLTEPDFIAFYLPDGRD